VFSGSRLMEDYAESDNGLSDCHQSNVTNFADFAGKSRQESDDAPGRWRIALDGSGFSVLTAKRFQRDSV